jgi:hypothetical protein
MAGGRGIWQDSGMAKSDIAVVKEILDEMEGQKNQLKADRIVRVLGTQTTHSQCQVGVPMPEIKHHPLLFSFRDAITGDGFLGGVTISGRALMEQESDGQWWMYGVRPGAIAESGRTPDDAFLRFRNRFKEVLFDIAEESKTFDDFKKEIERFFNEPNEIEERRWEDALTLVRKCNATCPPEPFSHLESKTPDTMPAGVSVTRLDQSAARLKPSDNVRDVYATAA